MVQCRIVRRRDNRRGRGVRAWERWYRIKAVKNEGWLMDGEMRDGR